MFYKPVSAAQRSNAVIERSDRFDDSDFLNITSKKLKKARQISLSEGNLAADLNDENVFPNTINNLNSMQQSHVLSTIDLDK